MDLCEASIRGAYGVVKSLLDNGADVSARYLGRTPLSCAAGQGHENVVKLLLGKIGIDVNAKDSDGQTALSRAAGEGHKEVVKLLLSTDGINPDPDPSHMDMSFEPGPLSRAASNGRLEVVKLLLATDSINPDSPRTMYHRTPLSLAAENGHAEVVKLLLTLHTVDVNSMSTMNRTPLSWAAENGHEGVVKLLLKKDNIDVDTKDKYGRTPLSRAAENGHEGVTKLLLERGDINANAKDNNDRTPLSWAAEKGHERVTKLLLERGDINANAKDNNGQTPLSWAAENGHEGVTKLLLERADIDANAKDNNGQAPLLWAVEGRHNEVVKLLLEKDGIDVNVENDHGQTPLSWAMENRYLKMVEVLLAKDGGQSSQKHPEDSLPLYSNSAGYPSLGTSSRSAAGPHLLSDMAKKLQAEPASWTDLLTQLSLAAEADLEHDLEYNYSYKRHVWVYRPHERRSSPPPLSIAGAPVIIPAPTVFPAIAPSGSPSDPLSYQIDPADPIEDNLVSGIFDAFPECNGFFLLLSGDLQVIVPEGFDYATAVESHPLRYGGLRVSYVPTQLLPTASGNWSRSARSETKPEIGGRIEAKKYKLISRFKATGRLGLQTRCDGENYSTISTHVARSAFQGRTLIPNVHASLQKPEDQNWFKKISVLHDDTPIGEITHSFDSSPDSYPLGYEYDISLLKLSKHVRFVNHNYPSRMKWASAAELDRLRSEPTRIEILSGSRGRRVGESIRSYQTSDVIVVGYGIMRQQSPEALRDAATAAAWNKAVTRMVLYRTRHNNMGEAMGMSGVPIVAEIGKDWGVVGFQSFVQLDSRSALPFITDPNPRTTPQERQHRLSRALESGTVAFYGAFPPPAELLRHTISNIGSTMELGED